MKFENPDKLYAKIQGMFRSYKRPTDQELVCLFENNPDWETSVIHIPARSGSTRFKNKNISMINGIPLIAYTIQTAKKIRGIDHVIVNTDSEEYAEIAMEYGAEVPFLRPKSLAETDSSLSKSISLILHYFYFIKKKPVSLFINMLPTNPFRNINEIQKSIELLNEHSHMQSMFKVPLQWDKILYKHENKLHFMMNKITNKIPQYNYFKGSGSLSGTNFYYKLRYGNKIFNRIINNPYEIIDIDTEHDFLTAKYIIENNLYSFN